MRKGATTEAGNRAGRKLSAPPAVPRCRLAAAFIVGGVTLVERFHVLTYLMGGFLIFAAAKTAFSSEEEEEEEQKPDGGVVRLARKVLPISDQMEGASFFVRREGKLLATPLVLALVAVETADIVFAVDSIPAVFGVTKSAFIALTSNIFAILGLRSLYFLLQGALAKLEYLKPGLAAVLAFVGIKMVVSRWVEIPAAASLAVSSGSSRSPRSPRSAPRKTRPTSPKPRPCPKRTTDERPSSRPSAARARAAPRDGARETC